MTADPARPRPRTASGFVKPSPRTVLVETFTVIHGGAAIDDRLAGELLGAVSDWAAAAEPGVTRVVEVWGPPWRRLLGNCAAIAAGSGAPLVIPPLPAADDLVAGLQARGVAVRYRQAGQSVMNEAELRAISQGWPVRYL
jgi:hypothetical protein